MGFDVSTQHRNEDGEQHTERTVTADSETYEFTVTDGTNIYDGDGQLPTEVVEHLEENYGPVDDGTEDSE
ncbi:hypothetical protein [Haloarchaeobius sp. TZWSO28]|uniref:hypothetical protein n=1 Tax=Haloarchaeobius sp. TZWSO28 TaxID=3446119 RepID=UPI003EBCBF85